MAGKNEVKVVFAGDATALEAASKKSEGALDGVGKSVDGAGKKMREATPHTHDMSEATDKLATKSSAAYGAIGALGSGFALLGGSDTPQWLQKAALGFDALSGVMDIATLAQEGLNLAWLTSPITWIVLGIIALVAVFVLLWNKCSWFRDFWIGLWDIIKKTASKVWDWLKGMPESLKHAFSGLVDIIVWPYKTAFNIISDAWNATIGKLSWTVPSWVPIVGGNTISAPKLPHFHSGGVVPGSPGQEVLAVLQAGERVIPAGGGGGTTVIEIRSGGSRLDDALVELLRGAILARGGNVQVVLGR